MSRQIDVEAVPDKGTGGGGDADNLLDAILRNALGGDVGIKKEHFKDGDDDVTVTGQRGSQAALPAVPASYKQEQGVKGEIKNELVKHEGVKGEIKSEIKRERSRSNKRNRSRDGKKKRSRSRDKKKRSRSRSQKKKKKKRERSSSSSSSKSAVQQALDGLPQARVVAVRGHWAQYLSPAGETFYKNVLSGEVQWQKPGNFDAVPSRRAGEMTPGPNEAACYIFHMPPEWSESDLMQLFSPFGQVTAAHVQRDANGFSRSCGFVTYSQQDMATQATNMMNGFGVDGKFLKVSLTQTQAGAAGPPGKGGGPP